MVPEVLGVIVEFFTWYRYVCRAIWMHVMICMLCLLALLPKTRGPSLCLRGNRRDEVVALSSFEAIEKE